MAQLPYLVYEQKPPMSSEAFKELAKDLMPGKDAAFLDKLTLNTDVYNKKKTGCSFVDKWHDWDRVLKLNLAKYRAIKLKHDNSQIPEPPAVHMDTAVIASKAVDESSPLEGEFIIDKARWNAIDGFAGNNYFDRNNAFAYFIKLLLLERRESFNTEKGFAEYKALYASIVESASVSRGEF